MELTVIVSILALVVLSIGGAIYLYRREQRLFYAPAPLSQPQSQPPIKPVVVQEPVNHIQEEEEQEPQPIVIKATLFLAIITYLQYRRVWRKKPAWDLVVNLLAERLAHHYQRTLTQFESEEDEEDSEEEEVERWEAEDYSRPTELLPSPPPISPLPSPSPSLVIPVPVPSEQPAKLSLAEQLKVDHRIFEDRLLGLCARIAHHYEQEKKIVRDAMVYKSTDDEQDRRWKVSKEEWDILLANPNGWLRQAGIVELVEGQGTIYKGGWPELLEWVDTHLYTQSQTSKKEEKALEERKEPIA